MRKRRALINIIYSFIYQIVSIAFSFIVPRLIIGEYGSATNGLVNSITSFIGYISILQLGAGSVIKASLYKPLAQKDNKNLSVIIKTTENFFKKIGAVSIIYILALAIIFPRLFSDQFDYWFVFFLILIIGASTVVEYVIGITYQMVLEADQKIYIFSIAQIVTVLLNTVLSCILIRLHCSIIVLKFVTTIVLIIRPIIVSLYCKKKYQIDRRAETDSHVISQRWDGFAQGMAYFIHSKTDIFVLTAFSNLHSISVYSVYSMITSGISSIVVAIDKACRSAFGNILALDRKEQVRDKFNLYNYLFHIICTSIFATAGVTQFSFISLYVRGITDAEYINTTFGLLLVFAEFFYCIRLPYNSIIFAAGKFRETKNSAFIEAFINLGISCVLVFRFGLNGIAFGTLSAMIYRTVSFVMYLQKNVLCLDVKIEIKRYVISVFCFASAIYLFSKYTFIPTTYYQWIAYVGFVFICISIYVLLFNTIFDLPLFKSLLHNLGRK